MRLDYEPAPPDVREELLEEVGHHCELCGAVSGKEDGSEHLEAHHIVPIPEGGTHDLSNLTLLCRSCHSWYHSLAQVRTAEANFQTISYQPSPVDLQVVLAIAIHGPATTRQIADFAGTTIETASQRLMKLTALEVVEPTIDLHNPSESASWNFFGLVENSAVGELPEDPKKAARLARDEMIRLRADRGESKRGIAQDLGLARSTVMKGIDRARGLKPKVPDLTTETREKSTSAVGSAESD